MLKKISLRVATRVTSRNGEVSALSDGQGNGITVKTVGRQAKSILQKDTAPHATHDNLTIDISEKEFRQQIVDLLKILHWRYYFTWNSIHSPAGFPDIVAVKESRLIFAELKREKGKLTPSQEEWQADLKACSQEVYIWRPSDFDLIVAILQS